MKERPILFSAEMVRAILEGRKTQTRRVVRITKENGGLLNSGWSDSFILDPGNALVSMCPYGQPGDRLWVREAFGYTTQGALCYRADGEEIQIASGWKPSIHMPRWASRITLEVTGVRVERLQDISAEDAIAEGLTKLPASGRYVINKGEQYLGLASNSPVEIFQRLWDSINAKRGYCWGANPWVWVVEFRRADA